MDGIMCKFENCFLVFKLKKKKRSIKSPVPAPTNVSSGRARFFLLPFIDYKMTVVKNYFDRSNKRRGDIFHSKMATQR